MPPPTTQEITCNILYVEDDDTTRNILSSIIRAQFPSAQLFTADNGETGLAAFHCHQPEIVVTDISMPVMSGLEMVRQIRETAPEIKVIVLTALNDIQSTLSCIELGVSQYVIKPVEHRVLRTAIERCLDSIAVRRLVAEQHAQIVALNAELTARATELEASNQELEAFNYTVSHDLRSPLTVIQGYTQLIGEMAGETLAPPIHAYLGEIQERVTMMDNLINALLDFSRINRQQLSRNLVNLSQLANNIVQNLRITDTSDRDISCRIAPGLSATGDQHLLRLVLDNLLGNAWKYTGKLAHAEIEFDIRDDGEGPVFFIRDNGAGFAQEQADHLFAPFQRLHSDDDFVGTGIGLATVKRIIQRHGCTIWAEGSVGSGATFFFTLPDAQIQ